MSRSLLKSSVVAAMLILAVLLFRDATIFGLRKANPVTGRGRGCYTELEILLGIKHPTEWIRFAELTGAGVLAVAGVAAIITWRKSE